MLFRFELVEQRARDLRDASLFGLIFGTPLNERTDEKRDLLQATGRLWIPVDGHAAAYLTSGTSPHRAEAKLHSAVAARTSHATILPNSRTGKGLHGCGKQRKEQQAKGHVRKAAPKINE